MNEALSNYVLKSDLNENYLNKSQAEEQFVNEDELAYELDKYVMKDELPTVDLTPYVLKSEVINKYVPTTTFSGYIKSADEKYRLKDDLSVNAFIDLPIEHKVPEGAYDFSGETAFAEFHEGAQLEGYAIVWNDETKDYIHQDFSITFHTEQIDDNRHIYNTIISSDVEGFRWNEKTNMFYAVGDVEIAVHLNSAKLYVEDSFALKTENEQLKTKINELESIITSLTARIEALESR